MNKQKNKSKNKKALSTIIATLFVIAFILLATSIVYTSIRKLTEDIQTSPEISCIDMQANLPIRITKACYNPETNEVEITLERNIDESVPISSLDFILSSKAESTTWCCDDKTCPCRILEPSTTKTYYFSVDDLAPQEKVALKISNCFIEEKDIGRC